MALLYLPVISWAAWRISRTAAIVLSFASVVLWLIADNLLPAMELPERYEWWEATIRFVTFAAFAGVLASLRESNERERQLARMDFLTGLYNSLAFTDLAEAEIARASRYQRPLSIVFLDCDSFKQVNDQYGHPTGDQLLRLVARGLRENSRSTDVIARMGGDEFVLLLPETDAEPARLAVEKLKVKLAELMQENGWPVTFSFGVATFREAPGSVSDMIQQADDLMYQIKTSTKNSAAYRIIG
jgi:diguanylate cyclase (GGDEF)-like protein